MMKELTEKEKRITVETRELLLSIDEKQKELVEHQTNLVNIKRYASGLAYPFFYQRSTHTALIQQLFRQTFEC
jgi:hypothetical protein